MSNGDLDADAGVALEFAPDARAVNRYAFGELRDIHKGLTASGSRATEMIGLRDLLADTERGHSGQLPQLNLGTFQIAVMGQSFHWTDRDDLLAELDGTLLPGGAVIIVGGPPPGDTAPPPWAEVAAETRTRYLGHERRAGSGTYSHPTETHQQVLARSPFSRVETTRWEHTVSRSRDDVVALQLSYSYSSPAQLGDSRAAFERDLGAALDRLEPSGAFLELVHTEVLIATRPRPPLIGEPQVVCPGVSY